MGRDLLASSRVFAAQIGLCEQALAPYVDWSLREVLTGAGAGGGLERVDVVQPVLFAVMVSLAEVWRSLGVRPGAVVGHSQGEVAAACVAGVLTLEDAARVVALRARALVALAGSGGMASLGVGVERVREILGEVGEGLVVAAVNGPDATVVAGTPLALEVLAGWCGENGVRYRGLPVDYASHSPQVERIREEVIGALAGLRPRAGVVPMYSAVTGGVVDGGLLDGGYWYRNLREPVRFDRATAAAVADRFRAFVECSPHPVLTAAVEGCLDVAQVGGVVVGSVRRDDGGVRRFYTSVAEAFVAGVEVDWSKAFDPATAGRVELPTYAFQRSRYWLESGSGGVGDVAGLGLAASGHPLLGAAVGLADGRGVVLTGQVSLRSHAWLADYAVLGTVILPGTAFVELCLHAGERAGCTHLEELTLHAPMVVPEATGLQVQVLVEGPDGEGHHQVAVYARPAAAGGEEGTSIDSTLMAALTIRALHQDLDL